jgi:hypothetical protein
MRGGVPCIGEEMTKQIDWAERVEQLDQEVVRLARLTEHAKRQLEKAELWLAEQLSQLKTGQPVRLRKQLKEKQVKVVWMEGVINVPDFSALYRYSPKANEHATGIVKRIGIGCRKADPTLYVDLIFDPIGFTVVGTANELQELLEKVPAPRKKR